ncbi:TM0106 family RecB-like putative nuclease [Microbacterium gorillae]|uniref:TM0106 family RecB-like putative nuclease n=1 Tax=Microbacterium gorillae TaxID=1231063 RepID=UPI00059102C4|nr:bifunctional RecB family nuclease/DEAD/DEAH box helicase [Microbacterium gorillae]
MRISDDGRVIWSATDLKKAAECEFAWMRDIDARLGRTEKVDEPEDAMLRRAIVLGLEHEHRVLADYHRRYPGGVIEIPDVSHGSPEDRERAFELTREALRSPDAQVVYQGAFRSDEFLGFADFIVRTPEGWLVQDTKLARSARVTALMQLAAYVDRLQAEGFPVAPFVELILGTGEVSRHAVADVMPVFRLRRERIRALIADRDVAAGIDEPPLAWADERGALDVIACGRCATCEIEVVRHRDLLLVAGMRPQQRRRLRAVGIDTVDALAASTTGPDDIAADVFASLRVQARLQLISPAGVPSPTEDADAEAHPVPSYEVVLPSALAILPPPDAGDMFFDFEGDPLYTEADGAHWGLDYLFGWVDETETYTALWAHSFAAEKQALETFLATVKLLRSQHPDMHIYHYAPYEPTHLAAMAARHGVGESDVDRLLAEGVFVDLYPVVKRAVRVGSRSYSIKKLEPLYMGDEVRTAEVQRGDESIERYVAARDLLSLGHADQAQPILDDLADYNRYDCVSTRRLRDWLRARAAEAGIEAAPQIEAETNNYEPSERATALLGHAAALPRDAADERSPEETALRLAAAAIDYHPRENRAFWAGHYLRLREPLSTWSQARDVLSVDVARSFVSEPWHVPERAHSPYRELMLRGELAPGSSLRPGSEVFTIYERPVPFPALKSSRWINVPNRARIVEVRDDGLLVMESGVEGVPWERAPIAVVPGPPPSTRAIQERIDLWADDVLRTAPALPPGPAADILLRRAPRTRSGALPPVVDGDDVGAIVAALRDLDGSYLAVQGPPGTGKTFVGSHVIARLVRDHGYRVGVVAQSHAVVENLLTRVVEAGLEIDRVGKATADRDAEDDRFTPVPRDRIADFRAEHEGAGSGFVLGGTAWDFCNPRRVPPASLDLLVIDEAGQYSLANTIATAVAARDLLLLGDPQQLPQVSQGTHPEPVDTSALGWVMGEHDVIPAENGYFLERSWRMRPEVAAVVSELSYEGRLASAEPALHRWIEGVEPGVHAIAIDHRGDSSHSEAEAVAVVRLVTDLLGRDWVPNESAPPRALTVADVIVVTPYNAQQQVVSDALTAAGLEGVRVGTVDKFQGQEAAVAIMSLAASSGRDAPRGLEFLLLPNRLNVAISRAQVAAYVIHSPGLLDDLPYTPPGVARLSAFARLVGAVPA